MNNNKTIIPTKEEVIKLLSIIIEDKTIHMETIGELIVMKWTDSILPKIENEPMWGYEGLCKFINSYQINTKDTLKDALDKLK